MAWRTGFGGKVALLTVVVVGASLLPAPANGGAPMRALAELEQGRWELRYREGGIQKLCVGDSARLLQLRHPDLPCTKIVLEDTPTAITVQYTCRGKGYGRTRLRRENARLIQLEAQGIADGLPFEFSAEGRRIGACAS